MNSRVATAGAVVAILAAAALFLPRPAQQPQPSPAGATRSSAPVVYVPVQSSSHPPGSPRPGSSSSAAPVSARQGPPLPGPASTRAASPLPAGAATVVATTSAPSQAQPLAAQGGGIVTLATLAPNQEVPKVALASPDAAPRIIAITLSTPVASGGEVVSGSVETSSNVAAVEAHVAGHAAPLNKTGPGLFTLSYRVPHLPFFLHRTYWIQVIAKNTAGVSVSSAVPITIH